MSDLFKEPRTKKGKDTLQRILDAASEEFGCHGYHDSSVYEIAGKAGIAVGTFYRYFDSKYNLYKQLLNYYSHDVRKTMSEATASADLRIEKERIGMREWMKYIKDKPYMYRVISESLYVDEQLFIDYYKTFLTSYMNNLKAAQINDQIKDVDCEVLSLIIMGALDYLGRNWTLLYPEKPLNAEKVADAFIEILENGIFK